MRLPVLQPGRLPASLQVRGLVARSNRFMIARLPASWIYLFALPHELCHYLAARALGLRAAIVPGTTIFEPAARWKTALVLMAPASAGVVLPVLWHMALWLAGSAVAPDWGRLALLAAWWWSGCLGDFIDLWLLARRHETDAERLARMQRLLERYGPALPVDWMSRAPAPGAAG
jgi:hypothetical protein